MATGILRGGLRQDEATLVLKNGASTQLTITHPATNSAARVLTLPADDAAYSVPAVLHGGDTSKVVKFSTSGSTTATALTLTAVTTANRALTLPDATDTLVGKATTDTFTNKTFDADGTGNVLSNVDNGNIKDAAAIALNKLAALNTDIVPITDGDGFIISSAVTATELGYLDGVTSAIQTQIDGKISADSSDVLENKTIDGDDNTLQDIAITSLKTDAGAASTFISRDGSGVVISTKAVPTGAVVGTSDTQTFTNKTYDAEGTGNVLSNITNTHIKSSAAIAFSKLAALTSGNILVGNGSNVATSVAMTGDISITNAGVTAYAGTVPINKGGTGQTAKTAAMDALSPTSTKGQLLVDDGTNVVAFSPGADGTVLSFDSAETTGLKAIAPLTNPMDAIGQLIYGGVSGAATKLAAGTDGQILMSKGGAAPQWLNTMTGAQKWTGRLARQEYVGTNPEVGGSSPFQMTDAHKRVQTTIPAGTATFRLPTTGILAGEIVEYHNRSSNDVTVTSSDGDTISIIQGGYIKCQALQDTPTDVTHWYVMEKKESIPLTGNTVTGGGTSPSYDFDIHVNNNVVTISGIVTTGTGSPTGDLTLGSTLIPARLRPANNMVNGCGFNSGTGQHWVTARSNGDIELARRNASLASVNFGTSAAWSFNISYVISS